jgi:hypothetical protein
VNALAFRPFFGSGGEPHDDVHGAPSQIRFLLPTWHSRTVVVLMNGSMGHGLAAAQ